MRVSSGGANVECSVGGCHCHMYIGGSRLTSDRNLRKVSTRRGCAAAAVHMVISGSSAVAENGTISVLGMILLGVVRMVVKTNGDGNCSTHRCGSGSPMPEVPVAHEGDDRLIA